MNQCAGTAFREADAKLNSAYAALRARLKDDPDAGKLLVVAQRAWIAFRDAECSLQASRATGGSLYPTIHAYCLRDLTVTRTKELQEAFSDER